MITKILAAVLFMATTSVVAQESAEPAFAETCREHMITDGQMTPQDLPDKARGREYSELVAVTYDLDGSGRAVNPNVVKHSARKLFDPVALSLLGRAQFTPGAVAQGCVYVRNFSAVRRRR